MPKIPMRVGRRFIIFFGRNSLLKIFLFIIDQTADPIKVLAPFATHAEGSICITKGVDDRLHFDGFIIDFNDVCG